MANPRSEAAKRLLKGAQQRRQAKNKKATASTMKNMKSVAKGTYANRSNAKAAEANVKSPVKATKKAKKATTKKTNYDNMSFSKAFAAGRKVALLEVVKLLHGEVKHTVLILRRKHLKQPLVQMLLLV